MTTGMTRVASIIGGGVIGGGWAARFLLNGWDVRVFDPDPEATRKIGEVLANARRSLPGLSDVALPPEGRLSFTTAYLTPLPVPPGSRRACRNVWRSSIGSLPRCRRIAIRRR